MKIEIFTDASVNLESKQAGFAYWVKCYQFEIQYASPLNRSTTGQAELYAINHAVKYLLNRDLIAINKIDIHTDSSEAIYKIKNAQHIAFFSMIELTQKNGWRAHQIREFFTISPVKAHTKGIDTASNCNRWCDFAAKQARHSRQEFKATIFDNSDILL